MKNVVFWNVGLCGKPLICSLKKPPEHDARSSRLQDYESQYTLAI
jgi:hypothetical protein